MHAFQTASITVPYRRCCEDRVLVLTDTERVVLAVADGAGGSGAGGQAADDVVREISAAASQCQEPETWCHLLTQIDHRLGAGESTAVVATVSAGGICGAGVGDSWAWLIEDGELKDLSAAQPRKPLLGSGEAVPVGFSHPPSRGLLILATDGFCNYVKREKLLRELPWIDFAALPRKLVEMVRLPSGELWDDVGIAVCRPRRVTGRRKRYDLDTSE
jgi:serine/threonine protein phosphatase PrpC